MKTHVFFFFKNFCNRLDLFSYYIYNSNIRCIDYYF